ncbi:hypothetical protein ACN9J5_09685 [Aliarcobacter butzleri]|uniref:hypothetical protein n=1 Tax=Aliarcobacter butzleri TaxID=28197 RepID=UPI003B2149C2
MFLGKCPYCDDGQIEVRKKEVRGKKVELFELSADSKCGFKIWQNALSRYGHYLKHSEVRAILNGEELELKFKSQKRYGQKQRVDYFKKVILHPEYGVEVLFGD